MRAPFSRFVIVVSLPFLASCVVAVSGPSEGGGYMDDSCPQTPPLCGDGSSPASYGIEDFPCSATAVEGWVANRCGHRQREHAWYLLAGLTAPTSGGEMLWRTWPTSTQTFQTLLYSSTGAGSKRSSLTALPGAVLERPSPDTPRASDADDGTVPGLDDKQLATAGAPTYTVPAAVQAAYEQCLDGAELVDGPTFQNEGNVMVAGVIFSPDVSRFIRQKRYWDAEVLDGLLADGDPAISNMPDASLVLKPMLWPVPGDGYVPVPLWDDLSPTADIDPETGCERYAGFERQELWRRAVAVTAGSGASPETRRSVRYLVDGNVSRVTALYSAAAEGLACGPRESSTAPLTYESAEVVSLDRFYTIRFTAEELAGLAACDRALLDASARWSYGRDFEAQDALALVAMHIMTKEQPGWTFQSAWWDDLPQACWSDSNDKTCPRYASHRPAQTVAGPATWRNYKMTTTNGMTQNATASNRYPPDVESGTSWPVAYNPFIELAATHPIETNCMNCHHRAAWPSRLSDRTPSGAYLLSGPGHPNVIEEFDWDSSIFEGLLRTDALWAISDRAVYPSKPLPPGAAQGER